MTAVDMVVMTVCALCAVVAVAFALIADARSHDAAEYARQARAFAPRRTEQQATEDVLEIDRGVAIPPGGIAPTVPIPIDRAVLKRASRARIRETSPRRREATVRPAQADSLHAPGSTSN